MPSDKDDKTSDVKPDKKSGLKTEVKKAPKTSQKASPKTKSKSAFILPLVILAALGGGVAGGFAVHKFWPAAPVAPPDFSNIDARIDGLQKALNAQAAQNKKLSVDVSKLEATWKNDLSQLETAIAERAGGPTGDELGEITAETQAARDALSASVDQLRGVMDDDVKAIEGRLKKLEEQMPTSHGSAIGPVFPKAMLLAQLDQSSSSDAAPKHWWDKFTARHVSVKRTDRLKFEAVLKDMDAAFAAGDWAALETHSQRLPEPAQSKAQEWIAATRP